MSTVMDYRLLDQKIAELNYVMSGRGKYERTPFCPTEEERKEYLKKCREYRKEAEELEVFDGASKIIRNRFFDVLTDIQDDLEYLEKHPASLLGGQVYYFVNLARLDSRSEEERIDLSLYRMKKIEEILDCVTDYLKRWPEGAAEVKGTCAYNVKQLKLAAEDIDMDYTSVSEEKKNELREGYLALEELLENYGDSIAVTESVQEHGRPTPERYREMLDKHFGVDLDELLRDYEKDVEETRNRVFSLAAQLPIPEEEKPHTMQEVSAVLNKYAGPADTAEEMFERIQDYLARGRKIAHENVNLPADEKVNCKPICRILKDTYPWGGYEMGDVKRRPIEGQMFLNNYNVSAVTDGWMKINAIHECYPGHHVQYVRSITDRTPECIKIDSANIPLIEGTSIRTETAFAEIYDDDPFYPVFAAYRRHHASVRIKVDLWLYIFGKSAEECQQLYIEELGFDPDTAMGQVRAQLTMTGYFTCYHYGLKKILQWEKESGLSRKEYTELLFRAGYIRISDFHEYLQLTEEEKYSYSHDYASLMRDFSDLPDMCAKETA